MKPDTVPTALDASGLVLFNAGCVYRRLRHDARRLGISWPMVTLLKDIELLEPVTQKELACVNHLSAPSISLAVKEMRANNWVSHQQNPADRRSATLGLTRRGRAKLAADGLALQKALLGLMQPLEAGEVADLIRAEGTLARLFHA